MLCSYVFVWQWPSRGDQPSSQLKLLHLLGNRPLQQERVLPRHVIQRPRDNVLGFPIDLACEVDHELRSVAAAGHGWPGILHQLVDFTSKKHTIGLVHQVHRLLVELLIRRNHLSVVTATVQCHINHQDYTSHMQPPFCLHFIIQQQVRFLMDC
jgi:hypothetical protein